MTNVTIDDYFLSCKTESLFHYHGYKLSSSLFCVFLSKMCLGMLGSGRVFSILVDEATSC